MRSISRWLVKECKGEMHAAVVISTLGALTAILVILSHIL